MIFYLLCNRKLKTKKSKLQNAIEEVSKRKRSVKIYMDGISKDFPVLKTLRQMKLGEKQRFDIVQENPSTG